MPQVSYCRLLLLGLLVLGVFFVELGSARLWDRDEPRNSRASHEMLARGDWIVPTFNGNLRDHKPVLLYWGQMLSYLALGESEFTARLPSALSAILSVLAIAVLASRLAGKPSGISQAGFWAAACLATCLLFVMAGRAATPDACLIAFSTLGIAALVTGSLAPFAPYSSGNVGSTRWLPAFFGYTMLGLAVLAKGPVGIILPLAVVHAWWMICYSLQFREINPASQVIQPGLASTNTNHRSGSLLLHSRALLQFGWSAFNPLQCFRAIWALRTLPGVLISLLAAAPWYVAVGIETEGQFLRGFFLDHNVGRAIGSMEGHDGSILFYPFAFLVGTFPWSLWLIPIFAWCRSASRESVIHRQMVILSGVWITVYLAAFSLASTKLPSYITPCYAGAALAIGGYWQQFENAWSRPSLRVRRAAYSLAMLVGLSLSVVLLYVSSQQFMPLLSRSAVAGLAIAVVGILGFVWEGRSKINRVPLTWLIGAVAFQLILFGFGAKSVDFYRQDLAVLTQLQQDSGRQAWLTIGGLEPSWVHYLDSQIVEVETNPDDPDAWRQVSEFLQLHPQGRVVVVGEAAHARMLDWQQQSAQISMVQSATAPRFLRPGALRVFEQANLSSLAANELVQSINTSPPTAPIRSNMNHPTAAPSLPASGTHADPASSPLRSAEAYIYPNPLRPQ